jgi:tRNA pseudouridine32 synthase / 23S rRNA pseudouridine746 synthase
VLGRSVGVGGAAAQTAGSLPLPLPGRVGEGGSHGLGIGEDTPPDPSPARGEGTHPSSGEAAVSSPVPAAIAEAEPVLTWLALTPLTGRTHQLRVHCAAMGFPILGDDIYGTAPRFTGPTLHLLAREIVVPIQKNKPPVHVSAPVPAHMRERLTACGWRDEG